jgi:two-component system response regulator DevR
MTKPPAGYPRIRIVLVDDSEVVRMGLRSLLAGEATFQVIGEAAGVTSGIEAVVRLKPDVVLLDIRLPDGSGFDACRQILNRAPEVRVLFLTSVADDSLVEGAIRAGGHGYLLKEIDTRALVQAIREVAAGRSVLDPAVTARVMEAMRSRPGADSVLAALSPQESRVLALISEGLTNKEVGVRLNLSEKTVKNYLSTVFEKLHVSRRAEAAAIYAQHRK